MENRASKEMIEKAKEYTRRVNPKQYTTAAPISDQLKAAFNSGATLVEEGKGNVVYNNRQPIFAPDPRLRSKN